MNNKKKTLQLQLMFLCIFGEEKVSGCVICVFDRGDFQGGRGSVVVDVGGVGWLGGGSLL